MTTNCQHFPQAADICLVCPIVFDWQRVPSIPHTYSATVAGFVIGRYDQPSDGSTWISITGPAYKLCPHTPKKFPDRISAELWAADTVRLLSVAPKTEQAMNGNPNDAPLPSNEPTGNPPGQQPEVETEQQPQQPFKPGDDELQQPGPDFADDEPGEDDDEDCDDLDDESTGFDDDDE